MKKILLITGTHGDERIGGEVLQILKKQGYQIWIDFLAANPKASNKGVRFIDADLNRVYPGKKDSAIYEKNIAYKNINKARRYDYVIDIHEASCGTDDFIIIPKKTVLARFPLGLIDLKKVILWPNPKGPVSQFLENSIELEFGMKNRDREEAINKAVTIIKQFIREVQLENVDELECTSKKDVYLVYGKLIKGSSELLKDFTKTKINKESFYPLLTGQYLNEGIICYKMRKVQN